MTIAYACDQMCMCVNFGDENILRGEECKTRVNLNFYKIGKTVNCLYSTGCKHEKFLDLI